MNEEESPPPEDLYDGPSKSQRKRDSKAITNLGSQLLQISDDQLATLPYANIIDAVMQCKKITKGNARKRQIQYIGKLLRHVDIEEIQLLVDRFDASSQSHVLLFHQLETWRDKLIQQDPKVMTDILSQLPQVDRQHLRQLTRNAITENNSAIEHQQDRPAIHYRKLFKYLKAESDNSGLIQSSTNPPE